MLKALVMTGKAAAPLLLLKGPAEAEPAAYTNSIHWRADTDTQPTEQCVCICMCE